MNPYMYNGAYIWNILLGMDFAKHNIPYWEKRDLGWTYWTE